MATPSDVKVTPGSGKNVATYSVSESSETKEIQRIAINDDAGTELGIAAAPLQVSLANTAANTNKLLVTPDSVALPNNQSVNESQINGVTPLMGNGVTGTGSQRVTVASDNTPFPIKIDQTTPGTTNAVKATNFPTTVDTNSGAKSASTLRTVSATDDPNLSNISSKLTWTSSDSAPQYNNMVGGGGAPSTTANGALLTNSNVETDNGSVRVNFSGSSLTTTLGTCTITAGSQIVTGTGFLASSVEVLSMVKLSADAETAYTPVLYITDTQLTLAFPYAGTGGTGTASFAPMATVTGSGGSISVASGQCTIASGTTTAAQTFIWNVASTGDFQGQAAFSISQRIANQDIYFGYEDNALTTISKIARFHFSSTDNTKVITETGWNPTTTPSSNEQETNTITLPNSATTASINTYKIAMTQDSIVFSINGTVVATHVKRIPHIRRTSQTGFSTLDLRVLNGTSPAGSTSLVLDYITGRIYNRLDTIQSSPGDITNSQVVSLKSATDSLSATQSITVVDSGSTTTAQQSNQNAITGTPTTGSAASFPVTGITTANVLITGTWTGTLAVEVSFDNGTTWFSRGLRLDGTNTSSGSITSNASGGINVGAVTNVRVRATAAVTGTAVVRISGSVNPGIEYIANTGSFGAGTTGTTAPTVATEAGTVAATALPTAVSSGQLTGTMGDKYGRQVVLVDAIRDIVGMQTTTITSSTSETTIGTAVASTFLDVTGIIVSNTSATAARVDFRDTTAGSVLFSLYVPAGDTRGMIFHTPAPQTSVNTNWTAQSSASVADLRVLLKYVKNK